MFNKNNFCHIASNNRNEKKAGVFVYKTTDDLETVSTSGYFNDKIVDINLHDLIIHEWHDPTDRTKVQKNVLCVIERTLDNVGTTVIKTQWEEDIEQDIEDLDGQIDALQEYVDNTFVRKDGTSVMTGPLKFRAGSFVGAIAGGLGDGIAIYKLKNDNSIDSEVASLTKENGFTPGTTNAQDIGSSSLKWKDAYIARVITAVLNNGANINVPTTGGTMALTSDIAIKSTEANIVNPQNGQFLMYDGTKWINSTQGYANTDLSNLTSTGKNIANWSTNITNCFVDIPQDIMLASGITHLSLENGSTVYFSDGTSVTVPTGVSGDLSRTTDYGLCYVIAYPNPGMASRVALDTQLVENTFSGPNAPTGLSSGTKYLWWDSTNKLFKVTTNAGSTWNTVTQSFPIGIVTVVNNGGQANYTIEKIINGFWYIDKTVYMLPGLKYLEPLGFVDISRRENNGTVHSRLTTITSITTETFNSAYNGVYDLVFSDPLYYGTIQAFKRGKVVYDEKTNCIYINSDVVTGKCIAASVTFNNGKIIDFDARTAFHAVDYNEALLISTPQTIKSLKTLSRAEIGQDEILKITTPNTGVKSEINYYDASTQNKIATQYFQKSGTEYHFAMAGWDPALNVASGGIYLVGKQVGANWTWHVEAPTPALSDDSSKIATTEWVRDLFSGGFSMPDYSQMVTLTSADNPYTPTKNGYLVVKRASTYPTVSVTNNTYSLNIAHIYCGDSDSGQQTVMVPVNKNEEYAFSPNATSITFIPAKGE